MKPCTHGWDCPEGVECPDCLWHKALCDPAVSDRGANEERMRLVERAVANAVTMLHDPQQKRIVIRAGQEQNLWKAIKIAREFREHHLAQQKRKESAR